MARDCSYRLVLETIPPNRPAQTTHTAHKTIARLFIVVNSFTLNATLTHQHNCAIIIVIEKPTTSQRTPTSMIPRLTSKQKTHHHKNLTIQIHLILNLSVWN